jgi:hypothetical protein
MICASRTFSPPHGIGLTSGAGGLEGGDRGSGGSAGGERSVSPVRRSAARASKSGCSAAVVAPTQSDRVEVSRLTPSRAKNSAWR